MADDKKKSGKIKTADLADEIGTDPKSLRRFLRTFLRSHGMETAGKGGEYEFDVEEVEIIREAYNAKSRSGKKVSVSFRAMMADSDNSPKTDVSPKA